MRRARLDGQRIGRAPLVLDNAAIEQDRQRGQSIREIAKGHRSYPAPQVRIGNYKSKWIDFRLPWIETSASATNLPEL